MTSTLLHDVTFLLQRAELRYSGEPAAHIRAIRERLDEPLRVAIAGRVKAGKSTLLNALIGEPLAPTDAGECTKIVTWYRHGPTCRATLWFVDGTSRQARFERTAGAIEVDLGGSDPDDIDRIVVEWPSNHLRDLTLIDTPGIASIRHEVSARSIRFFGAGEDEPTEADAVLYLMRHLHATDLDFLEAFHDDDIAQASPINAIALLSRADEIGVGRPDAMRSARRIASRYRQDPKLRALCQTVLPIAALLAETGATLTEEERRALGLLAACPRSETDGLLLSADRFVDTVTTSGLTALERQHLLARLGMFGARTAIAILRQNPSTSAGELAAGLVRRSGLTDVRDELRSQFASRRETLKSRSALLALAGTFERHPMTGLEDLRSELERVIAGAHEFAEIRILNAHRSGAIDFGDRDRVAADLLLGARGGSVHQRLGLVSQAGPDEVRAAILASIARWRRRAENPLTPRIVAEAAEVLARSCEGMLTEPAEALPADR
jgi:predicted GTPase